VIGGIDLFRIGGARMRYLAERQNVLAQNIANADTPNYEARDLRPFSFSSALLSSGQVGAPLRMAATNDRHLGVTSSNGRTVVDEANAYADDPSGNNVVLEEQMVKQADVVKAYEMSTAVYRHGANLLRMAIGKTV
jgi:flagellar basal-body rod protein FlgB